MANEPAAGAKPVRDWLGITDLLHLSRRIDHRIGEIMTTLAELETKFTTLASDVTRVAADLKAIIDNLNAGGLNPANQAEVDKLAEAVDALDAAVNAADQTPPTA